ncbi:MAG: type II toxin-antitoxin system RelE/ParE family toxin [Romboutsia sp.]|nr:type II toxin-antitoxin system RelE/ParE family toxin [Romboutsia sp.]
MNFKFAVLPSSVFKKQFKKLAKKYPSIKNDLLELVTVLEENPLYGTPIGNDCYKIRLAITSKNKGKSGGARVITHVVINDKTVFLLTIYDKTDTDTLTNKEILEIIKAL